MQVKLKDRLTLGKYDVVITRHFYTDEEREKIARIQKLEGLTQEEIDHENKLFYHNWLCGYILLPYAEYKKLESYQEGKGYITYSSFLDCIDYAVKADDLPSDLKGRYAIGLDLNHYPDAEQNVNEDETTCISRLKELYDEFQKVLLSLAI